MIQWWKALAEGALGPLQLPPSRLLLVVDTQMLLRALAKPSWTPPNGAVCRLMQSRTATEFRFPGSLSQNAIVARGNVPIWLRTPTTFENPPAWNDAAIPTLPATNCGPPPMPMSAKPGMLPVLLRLPSNVQCSFGGGPSV